MPACQTPFRRRAFTLIEMLLALALAAVVLSTLQSLILVAGRAVPDADGVQTSTVESADVLERLAAEVSVAVEVLDVTSHNITFSVNDWTGDGVVETIKYAWSGTVGDPLLRAVNGGAATVLVDSVEDFVLTPVTASESVVVVADEGRLEDRTVQSVDVLSLIANPLSRTAGYAQRVVPNLPSETETWRIEDVRLWVKSGAGSSGDLIVEIRDVDTDSGKPGGVVYQAVKFSTDALTNSTTQVDIHFGSAKLSPSADVCIVVRAEDAGVSCNLDYGTALSTLAGRVSWSTSDGGATWGAVALQAMHHRITADIWTRTTASETRTVLEELQGSLRQGSPRTTIVRSVRPLNTPEVLP